MTLEELENLKLEIAVEGRIISITNTGLDGIIAQRKAIDQAEKDLSQRLAACRLRHQTLIGRLNQETHENRVTQILNAAAGIVDADTASLTAQGRLDLRASMTALLGGAINFASDDAPPTPTPPPT